MTAEKTIGPYLITGTLGRGGMGVVYDGLHCETGERAAIKTVAIPDPSFLAGIRREIHALAAIHHPGIVRITADGVEKGIPWYAMELVAGTSLERYCGPATEATRALGRERLAESLAEAIDADAVTVVRPAPIDNVFGKPSWWTDSLPGGPLPDGETPDAAVARPPADEWDADLEIVTDAFEEPEPEIEPLPAGHPIRTVLTIARRLCAPLAFLHGEGIIHRDLKPANVLVRANGHPVLVDFGLMSAFGGRRTREALEVDISIVGTAGYISPEQAQGQPVDARADLYSLGCILFHLLTGRLPFLASEGMEMIRQHVFTPPEAPSLHNPEVPPALDRLVLRLLAKHPAERMGHAADVARVLGQLGGEGWTDGRPYRPRTYLYRPGFAGRKTILSDLFADVRQLLDGQGGLVLVEGTSGIGKTRILAEIGREAAQTAIETVSGAANPALHGGDAEPVASGEPLHLFRGLLQFVADRCRSQGALETQRLLGWRARVLAEYEPSLRFVPGFELLPPAPVQGARETRQRAFRALAEVFATLAVDRPYVVLLDDLHWADELSIEFLAFLAAVTRFERFPVLFVGSLRSDAAGVAGDGSGHSAWERLRTARQVQRIHLGPLEEKEIREMVAAMLALEAPPAPLVRFLVRQGKGNPYFATEYLRTAIAAEVLFRDDDGHWRVSGVGQSDEAVYDQMPRSIRELVARRLEGLAAPEQTLVRQAAVIGAEIDEALLTGLLDPDFADFDLVLAALERQRILQPAEPGRLRFVHQKIREVAYDAIPISARPSWHRRIAEAIEALPKERRDEHLGELGQHWERAGEAERAAGADLEGARRAARLYLHHEAERLYGRFLAAQTAPTVRSVAARIEMARHAYALQGRHELAAAAYRRAFDEAKALRDPELGGTSLQGLSTLARRSGRLAEARIHSRAALDLLRKTGKPNLEASALTALAAAEHELGSCADGTRLFEQAAEIYRRLGLSRLLGITLGNLARVVHTTGDEARALALEQEALALHRAEGNRRSEAITLDGIGDLQLEAGRLEDARRTLEDAANIAREIDDRETEAAVLCHLAELEEQLGRIEMARFLFDRALAMLVELGDSSAAADIELRFAAHRRRTGDDVGALERRVNELAALHRRSSRVAGLVKALVELGHLALAQHGDARHHRDEAESILGRCELGVGSPLGKRVARLSAAIRAAASDQPLYRGELPSMLPEALRVESAT